jgi:predicted nucleotidyltransferase
VNLKELRNSGKIIYEAIGGSIAYGTNNENSDQDLRGFYINDKKDYLSLNDSVEQVNDAKNDIVFYDLKRAFHLLTKASPNMIEMLWYPNDCVIFKAPIMDRLIENRKLFISKKAYYTHAKYAESQIKKAKGANKRVHNPMPEERPVKEDFCWVIPKIYMDGYAGHENRYTFPCRPVPLKDAEFAHSKKYDLSEFHVSNMEHSHNIYRLYYYGEDAKGVFRGDEQLVCESIPFDDEFNRFGGLLLYNQDAYEQAVKKWKEYWTWRKERNESRWTDQEKGNLDFDGKNMMHCVRLLICSEYILEHGEPLVRFEGEKLDYLMNIRAGNIAYEDIMKDVNERMKKLEKLKETSKIPENVDHEGIDNLFLEIIDAKSYISGDNNGLGQNSI